MADKPSTAAGYTSEHLELVRSTCLYVATKLGDLMNELVIVGGLIVGTVGRERSDYSNGHLSAPRNRRYCLDTAPHSAAETRL